ncbi:uncharacterized protein N0V89_010740 [Didymosphaeria variabile]|uniref:Arylsulfotransferase n=1 Tax=Didymosphaeria variabile TaxID=1932322 RepID=A0A9W9C6V8_9PLEO|nr:uncharacterized protein N0V89_010740 [Didymosphaeria variabile]KAJ4346808.1 hypothetical protein N0V89_010740 [Didymosphaeria variabile]
MRVQSLLVALSAVILPTCAQNNTAWPFQTFRSLPGFEPPQLEITQNASAAPGLIFFPISGDGAHNYSLNIYDQDGELVWQSGYGDYAAFRPTELFGEPVLAAWSGISFPEPWGFGYGIVKIFNQNYENIYNVTLWNTTYPTLESIYPEYDPTQYDPFSWIDMHENNITPRGTMFVGAVNVTAWDLTSIGGPEDGWIVDSLVLELNVTNSEILWQWSHLAHVDHIPLTDAVPTYPLGELGQNQSYPWGPFHINSVDEFEDGSLLVSSRHYCSIFKIGRDGEVQWTLNGYSGGDFTLKNDLHFCYQHDARIHSENSSTTLISIFNNDNSAVVSYVNQTTGIFLSVNTDTKEATLVKELYDPSEPIYAVSQGDHQLLSNGHSIMGYGSVPFLKEFDKHGNVVQTVKWGQAQAVQSYRTYKSQWVGTPSTRPDVFACAESNATTSVHMSWNGATEHQSWKVLAGSSREGLRNVTDVKKTGFETSASISGHAQFVQVEAHGDGIKTVASTVVAIAEAC